MVCGKTNADYYHTEIPWVWPIQMTYHLIYYIGITMLGWKMIVLLMYAQISLNKRHDGV